MAVSAHTIDVEFVPMLNHVKPAEMGADLQRRIHTATTERSYDQVLLGFGLCGNTIVDLVCPIPMVIPRVHDCCTLFMGSKERFMEAFGDHLSMHWCTGGYFERGYNQGDSNYDWDALSPGQRSAHPEYMQWVEQYGEENAAYIWETMYSEMGTAEAAYIRMNVPAYNDTACEERFSKMVSEQGKTVRILQGDISYLDALINGPWDDARFLTVQPGQRVRALYDMDRVITTQ
ncbi:MAG: DUF1638 domain-containing protein [Defluviitaleaceae bacterium]|nr:DUF1638 domain-containing protein [Defluviitaleaceae bacterium]